MSDALTTPGTDDPTWFKSSYSSDEGGACLEVAYIWRRSSYSDEEGGNCLEVATSPGAVRVRDSKTAADGGPTLTLPPAAWETFTRHVARRV